jgi:hypothetical protein
MWWAEKPLKETAIRIQLLAISRLLNAFGNPGVRLRHLAGMCSDM